MLMLKTRIFFFTFFCAFMIPAISYAQPTLQNGGSLQGTGQNTQNTGSLQTPSSLPLGSNSSVLESRNSSLSVAGNPLDKNAQTAPINQVKPTGKKNIVFWIILSLFIVFAVIYWYASKNYKKPLPLVEKIKEEKIEIISPKIQSKKAKTTKALTNKPVKKAKSTSKSKKKKRNHR